MLGERVVLLLFENHTVWLFQIFRIVIHKIWINIFFHFHHSQEPLSCHAETHKKSRFKRSRNVYRCLPKLHGFSWLRVVLYQLKHTWVKESFVENPANCHWSFSWCVEIFGWKLCWIVSCWIYVGYCLIFGIFMIFGIGYYVSEKLGFIQPVRTVTTRAVYG